MVDEEPDQTPPHPFDYVSRDAVQDLWGIGYTIVRRARGPDPFYVPPEMVPQGRSYQWWHLVQDKCHFDHHGDGGSGWAAVPASRHEGYFMPFGTSGAIEVGGLGLFEKSKFEVDAEKAQQVEAAQKLVADWVGLTGKEFSGGVSVGGVKSEVGDPTHGIINQSTKTIDARVKLPPEMLPYMAEIFVERDRLYALLIEAQSADRPMVGWMDDVSVRYYQSHLVDPNILKGPTLNALLLPYAIQNVRERLTTPYQPPKE